MRYDFAIVGTGAAGLQLALKMLADDFFKNKTICLIDKAQKTSNDRTWSFWEKGTGKFDHLITKSWEYGKFISTDTDIKLPLSPYRYKTLRSAAFYSYALDQLSHAENFTFMGEEVLDVVQQTLHTGSQTIEARHIFDSRVPGAFHEEKDRYNSLVQHFHGWFIKTDKQVFDPEAFVMMDYRLKWQDETSFTYVLPFSETEALVEFTLFNKTLLKKEQYEDMLRQYFRELMPLDRFEIIETETGQIPMSDYPFHRHHEKHLTKIGTAGGWVRPSSGYSFKNGDRYTDRIIQNIKSGKPPHHQVATGRFRLYDRIFLHVLSHWNHEGENIFSKLYRKNKTPRLLRFLDEQSTLAEDMHIMGSLNSWHFRKAFVKELL